MSLTEIIFHEYEKKALKIMIIILYHVHVPIYFFIPQKKKRAAKSYYLKRYIRDIQKVGGD
jgi:hypothetical protein